jgi:hypothetical protein
VQNPGETNISNPLLIGNQLPRIANLSRGAGWAAVGLIAILSLVPGELRPHRGVQGPFEHFTAYLLTALPLVVGYSRRLQPRWIALALIAYAACLETAQLWIPARVAAVIDFTAGSLGSIFGGSLRFLLVKYSPYCPASAQPDHLSGTAFVRKSA